MNDIGRVNMAQIVRNLDCQREKLLCDQGAIRQELFQRLAAKIFQNNNQRILVFFNPIHFDNPG